MGWSCMSHSTRVTQSRLMPDHGGPLRAQETATTCRERCGGQGYLSVNKFGAILGFAHAGMTAEGDNRVLMQKARALGKP